MPAKQGLDIYTDEPEQEDRNSCRRDGIAFQDVYEVDNSKLLSQTFTSCWIFSTVSPMLVDSVLHSQSEDEADFGIDVINATGNGEETNQCLREAEIRYRPKVYFMRETTRRHLNDSGRQADLRPEKNISYELRFSTWLSTSWTGFFCACLF